MRRGIYKYAVKVLSARCTERKALVVCSCVFILLTVYAYLHEQLVANKFVEGNPERVDDVLRPIHFIQTTENPVFDYRCECSVESAAMHNPDRTIIVTFVIWRDHFGAGPAQLFFLQYLQIYYPNVIVEFSRVEDVLSPLVLDWYKKQFVHRSPFAFAHLSDALRLSVIFANGGAYFDTDIISIDKFNETDEFLSFEYPDVLCSGVFQFRKRSSLLLKALRQLPSSYDQSCWGCVGPALISRAYVASRRKPMILPPNKFFPLSYDIYEQIHSRESYIQVLDKCNGSYGVHLFNHLEERYGIQDSIFLQELYRRNCPHTYKSMQSEVTS